MDKTKLKKFSNKTKQLSSYNWEEIKIFIDNILPIVSFLEAHLFGFTHPGYFYSTLKIWKILQNILHIPISSENYPQELVLSELNLNPFSSRYIMHL